MLTLLNAGHASTGTAFNPASVAGLLAWWDFSSATYLRNGSSAQPTNGQTIATAIDRRAPQENATQATDGSRPTFSTSGPNGMTMASFTGGTKTLDFSAQDLNEFTAFFAFKRNTTAAAMAVIGSGAAAGTRIMVNAAGTQVEFATASGATKTFTLASAIGSSAWVVLCVARDEFGQLRCWVNGTESTTGTLDDSTAVNFSRLGAQQASNPLDAGMMHAILYFFRLSGDEINSVGDWLADEAGLTWTPITDVSMANLSATSFDLMWSRLTGEEALAMLQGEGYVDPAIAFGSENDDPEPDIWTEMQYKPDGLLAHLHYNNGRGFILQESGGTNGSVSRYCGKALKDPGQASYATSTTYHIAPWLIKNQIKTDWNSGNSARIRLLQMHAGLGVARINAITSPFPETVAGSGRSTIAVPWYGGPAIQQSPGVPYTHLAPGNKDIFWQHQFGNSVVADAGNSTTQFKTNQTESTTGRWVGATIQFRDTATNANEYRVITAYNGATKTMTVDPALPSTPAPGDVYFIFNLYRPSDLASTFTSFGAGPGRRVVRAYYDTYPRETSAGVRKEALYDGLFQSPILEPGLMISEWIKRMIWDDDRQQQGRWIDWCEGWDAQVTGGAAPLDWVLLNGEYMQLFWRIKTNPSNQRAAPFGQPGGFEGATNNITSNPLFNANELGVASGIADSNGNHLFHFADSAHASHWSKWNIESDERVMLFDAMVQKLTAYLFLSAAKHVKTLYPSMASTKFSLYDHGTFANTTYPMAGVSEANWNAIAPGIPIDHRSSIELYGSSVGKIYKWGTGVVASPEGDGNLQPSAWLTFVYEYRRHQSAQAASNQPILCWITAKSHLEQNDNYRNSALWDEQVIHALMANPEANIVFYAGSASSGRGGQPYTYLASDWDRADDVINEVDSALQSPTQNPLLYPQPEYDTLYVISTVDCNGKFITRLTPDPACGLSSVMVGTTLQVTLNRGATSVVLNFPTGSFFFPAGTVTTSGVWIQQTRLY